MLVPGQTSTDYWQVVANIRERLEQVIAKPWLPHVVNVTVLALLAASLAQWTWLLFAPKTPQVVAQPVTVNETTPMVNVQAILGANLFGVAPVTGTGNIENIPLSSLNLVLTGLVAAGNASYALIRVEGQPEAPFAIGQVITAGAVLQAVYPDRAIISRGGVAESLLLEGAAQPLSGSIGTPAMPRAGGNQAANMVPEVREQGPNNYLVSRESLNSQMRNNPQKMLSQSLMVPNPGGGFLVREIQPGSVYEKLGLRAGDVVRTANGQTLNTLEDAMRLYQQSDQNNYINLEIVRNGKPEVLQYTLQ